MNLLLDTHILLWVLASPKKLPEIATKTICQAGTVFFSPVNLWEIGTKSAIWPEYNIGCIDDIYAGALKANLRELPVYSADTMAATRLPLIHRDPIDRILIAQSHNNECYLLTVDGKISLYEMPYVMRV